MRGTWVRVGTWGISGTHTRNIVFPESQKRPFLVSKAAKQGKKTLDKIKKDMAGVGGPHPFPNLTEYGAVRY